METATDGRNNNLGARHLAVKPGTDSFAKFPPPPPSEGATMRPMRERQLRRVFQHALALASVGSAASCGPPTEQPAPHPITPVVAVQPHTPTAVTPTGSSSAGAPTPPSTPQLFPAPSICADPVAPNPLANLQPTVPVDYVEVRRVGLGRGGIAPGFTAVHQAGHRCAGAPGDSSCEQAYEHVQLTGGFVSNCVQIQCNHHVLYTHGDQLSVISTRDAFKKFLGPIDSKGEALLWVWANGYETTDCDGFAKGGLTETNRGFEVKVSKLISDCPWTTHNYRLAVARDGAISVARDLGEQKSNMCAGRMPPRHLSYLRASQGASAAATSAYADAPAVAAELAEMAFLESAAVVAFEQLVEELVAYHAPTGLIAAARAAAADERRHARVITNMAEECGAQVVEAALDEVVVRSLLELALDNAREGCIRETYGALLGSYQAQHSQWPAFAHAMHTIAADELRHAAFSWELADWLHTQLSEEEQRQVAATQQAAAAELVLRQVALAANEPSALQEALGRPPQQQAITLATALADGLWQGGRAA